MREIGKNVLSYTSRKECITKYDRMDDLSDWFIFYQSKQKDNPPVLMKRCIFDHLAQRRNRIIRPFVDYVYQLFRTDGPR